MKAFYGVVLLLLTTGCSKELKCSRGFAVKIRIENANDGTLVNGFTYEIESYGIGNVNNEIEKTGSVTNGETAFCYKPEGVLKVHELQVIQPQWLNGYIVGSNTATITEDNRSFVFQYMPG